jgi:glucose-1-phosphate thymidylyltransferase
MPRATLAVVLARGLGRRLRADDGSALAPEQVDAAARGSKALVPLNGRPLLDYVLHELADGGVTDVVFVVAPDDEAIRARYERDAPPTRLQLRYAIQREPRGTADALLAARDAVEAACGAPRDSAQARHFLVCNADNLYPAAAVAALVDADGPGLAAFSADALTADGSIDAERVRQFALLALGGDDVLAEIVEKPDPAHALASAAERWVSMNLWRFTDRIFGACARVAPSPRGELELTDAVRLMIDDGAAFRAHRRREAVLDLSHRRDIAALEKRLTGRVPRP